MRRYVNNQELVGDLVNNPTYNLTHSGTPVINFILRTRNEFRRYDGNVRSEDTFHNITIFGQLAENVEKMDLRTGDWVQLSGRTNLVRDSSKTEVIVKQIEKI